MNKRLRVIAHTIGDLYYSRAVRIAVGSIVGLWVLMMVLGVEVLTGTEHHEEVNEFRFYSPETYVCNYWTGTGFRSVSYEYGVPQCPVWRWGRQFAD